MSKLLSIVIPTKGQPNYLEYVLKHYSKMNITKLIDLYICDASNDDSIKNLVDNYSDVLDINYFCVESDVGFDQQTLYGIRLPKTKFIYLCGHGVIYREDKLKELLDVLKKTDYDLYLTMGDWCDQKAHSISNKDNNMLLKYWFAALTMYGGSVLSKRLIDRYDDKTISKYFGTYFAYTCYIFEYLDSPYYIFENTLFEISEEKMKNSSFWSKSRIIEMWSTNYCKAIDLLPDKYNNYKHFAYKLHDHNILSKKSIMFYRTNGNFNYKIYKNNKNFLPLASECSSLQLIIISLIPSFIFKLLYYIKHRTKPWKR